MKVLINEKYAVNINSDGFTLLKLSTVKEGEKAGEVNESFAGYFPKIEQLCNRILLNGMAESEDEVAIKELANAFLVAAEKIADAIEGNANEK